MVPVHEDDTETSQHMTTFTVGLGARGRMIASPTYKNDGNQDYGYIKVDTIKGPATCVWPVSYTHLPYPYVDDEIINRACIQNGR